MDYCYLCKKEVSFWKSNKVKLDNLLFCENCANERWPKERKQKMLSIIYEGTPPIEFTRIEKVTTEDPNIKKTILMGHLFFTNKGICFAELAQYELVGLVRTVISSPAETAWSRAKPSGNLNNILKNSPRLIFYPIDTFKDVQVKKGVLGISIDIITHKFGWNHYDVYGKNSYSDYEAIKNEIAEYLKNPEYLKNIDSLQVSEAGSVTGKKAISELGTREIDPSDFNGKEI